MLDRLRSLAAAAMSRLDAEAAQDALSFASASELKRLTTLMRAELDGSSEAGADVAALLTSLHTRALLRDFGPREREEAERRRERESKLAELRARSAVTRVTADLEGGKRLPPEQVRTSPHLPERSGVQRRTPDRVNGSDGKTHPPAPDPVESPPELVQPAGERAEEPRVLAPAAPPDAPGLPPRPVRRTKQWYDPPADCRSGFSPDGDPFNGRHGG